MSFQSSILNMIHTTAAGLKAAEFVKGKAAEEPEEPKKPQAPKPPKPPETMQPKTEPQVKEEPVFIGGQQVSPELAAKIRDALAKKQTAEASLVVAQQQKRAKRAKAFSEEPMRELAQFKHLGMEAMF